MRYRFDNFDLDTESGQLLRDGVEVPLRRQTFRLLRMLLERAPALLDRDTLLDEVWGHQALSPNVLPQAISELRQALGDSPQSPRFIETRHRRGYRFRAPITVLAQQTATRIEHTPAALLDAEPAPRPTCLPSAPDNPAEEADESIVVAGASTPLDPRSRLRGPFETFSIPLAVAIAVLLALLLALHPHPTEPLDTPPAVLALGPFSQAPGLPEWVAPAGLEVLGAELADQPRLRLLRSDALDPGAGLGDLRWQQRMHALLGAPLAVGGRWLDDGSGKLGLEISLIDLSNGHILMTHRDSAGMADLDLLAERASEQLGARLRLPQTVQPAAIRPAAQIRLRYWNALESLARGEPERAADALEALQSPEADWLLPSLVRAYRESGQSRAAASLLADRLARADSLPLGERLRLQAELGLLQSQPGTAAAALAALVELFPDDVEAQLQLAAAQLDALQGEAARHTLRKLNEQPRARHDPRFLLLRARAARLDGRFDEALALAQQGMDASLHHRLPGMAAAAALSLSETLQRQGDLKAAAGPLQSLLLEPHASLPGGTRAQLQLKLLSLFREQGREEAARSLLQDLHDQPLADALTARLAVEAALLEVVSGDLPAAATWLQRAAHSAEALADPELAIAWRNAHALRALAAGELDAATEGFDTAFSLARLHGLAGQTVALQVNAGLALARQGRFSEAEDLWMQALQVFEQLGDLRGQATCLGNLAAAASATGRAQRAAELNQQALLLFRQLDLPGPLARTAYNLSLGARRSGDLSTADALLVEALAAWKREGHPEGMMQAGVQRAELLLARDEVAAAEAQLLALRAEQQDVSALSRSHWLAASAKHSMALGQLESARELESSALALRREAGHAGWVALGTLNLLRIDLLSGADPLTVQLESESLVRQFEQLGDARDLARAQLLRAEALLARGQQEEASHALLAARHAADSFGDIELELRLDWVASWTSRGVERRQRLMQLRERAVAIGQLAKARLVARSLDLMDGPTEGHDFSQVGAAPPRPRLPPYVALADAPLEAGGASEIAVPR